MPVWPAGVTGDGTVPSPFVVWVTQKGVWHHEEGTPEKQKINSRARQ